MGKINTGSDKYRVFIGSVETGMSKAEIGEYEECLVTTDWVKKSNLLINQIGARSSLLAEKVFLYSLTVIEKRGPGFILDSDEAEYYKALYRKTKNNFAEGLVSVIKNTEFRKVIRNRSGSYYTSIERMMNTGQFRKSWDSLYRDKDIISEIAVVIGTAYDKERGCMFIKFNSDVEDLLYDLKKDYTTIPVSVLYLSNSVYEVRSFQLFRSRLTYMQASDRKIKRQVRKECVFRMSPSEFKFQMGISGIDSERTSHQKAKDALKNGNNYELAESLLPVDAKGESRYCDLEKRILLGIFRSINGFEKNKNDSMDDFYGKASEYGKKEIYFYFRPIRKGKGGKVVNIEFTVGWVKDLAAGQEKEKETGLIDILELTEQCFDIIPLKLPAKDYRAILKAADYDILKVQKAVSVLEKQKKVTNVTAFLIAAIQGDYELQEVEFKDRQAVHPVRPGSFQDFPQREYDYNELEKQFIMERIQKADATAEEEDIMKMLQDIRKQ